MTVRELVLKLTDMNPDAEVQIALSDDESRVAEEVAEGITLTRKGRPYPHVLIS